VPKDPRPAAINKVLRARAMVARNDDFLSRARRAYRTALLDARAVGVSKVALAEAMGTSESRVRQEIARAESERDAPKSA
jgi:DNA-directed RNA polymerase specialized sigma24 family protein